MKYRPRGPARTDTSVPVPRRAVPATPYRGRWQSHYLTISHYLLQSHTVTKSHSLTQSHNLTQSNSVTLQTTPNRGGGSYTSSQNHTTSHSHTVLPNPQSVEGCGSHTTSCGGRGCRVQSYTALQYRETVVFNDQSNISLLSALLWGRGTNRLCWQPVMGSCSQ